MQPPRRKIPFLETPAWTTLLLLAVIISRTNSASVDSFVYVGCSQLKTSPGAPYESSVNSLLTSMINAAGYSTFDKLTVGGIYGLFQCRPDLSSSDCASCVERSVSRLGALCSSSVAGALQLDGCYLRYDNATFFGVEDKSVVVKRCGPQTGDSDGLARREAVLGYLGSGGELFRVEGSGDVRGVAECVGDLSVGQCQDCLGDAIGRLRSDCGSATWGDVFLAKCYARFAAGGSHAPGKDGSSSSSSSNDDETEKTLAILIGLIAVVAVIVIFASFLRKSIEDKGGK